MDTTEQLRERVGSMADILSRHGFHPKRPLCPNPAHQDRRPGSVSIYIGRRGNERIRCHSCGLSEDNLGLAKLLGEDVFPSRGLFSGKRVVRREERVKKFRIQRWLEDNPQAVEAFRVARRLAELTYDDALSELFQIRGSTDSAFGGMVLSFSDRIRKQALERYADPELKNDPEVVKSSVRKLLAVSDG